MGDIAFSLDPPGIPYAIDFQNRAINGTQQVDVGNSVYDAFPFLSRIGIKPVRTGRSASEFDRIRERTVPSVAVKGAN
jgi:hypothetical protein